MTRRVFRHIPYSVEQDETAEPVYEAECVSTGEEAECGAESGPHHDPGPVEEWMCEHNRDTGHSRYLRIFSDYAVTRPVPGAGEPGQGRGQGGTA